MASTHWPRLLRWGTSIGIAALVTACGSYSPFAKLASVMPGAAPASPKSVTPATPISPATKSNAPHWWDAITTLEQQAPYTAAGVERALGVPLEAYNDPTESRYDFYRAPVVTLADDAVIANVDLRIRKGTTQPGFLVLEIDGICIALAAVQTRFPALKATDPAPTPSPQETAVFSATRPWGRLSFVFKGDQEEDCLAMVVFNTAPPAAAH